MDLLDRRHTIAGRPLLTQSGIVVPTKDGSLVRVNSTQGDIIERLQLSSDLTQERGLIRLLFPKEPHEIEVGNLLSLGGRLVSVSSTEMTAFEWKSDEDRWRTQAPTDAESTIRWAQSIALRGQFAEAAQALRDSAPLAASDDSLLSRHRQALTSVLLLQSESERQRLGSSHAWREWLNEARTPETSPEDLEAAQRLEIELAIQSGEWETAWSQVRLAIRQPLRISVEIDHRIVSPDAWLAERILNLGQIPDRVLGDAMRETIRAEFKSLWDDTLGDRSGRERLLRLFAETSFVDRAELDTLQDSNDPLLLTKLQALALSRDRPTAIQASVRLIDQLATPDWVDEARRRLSQLPATDDWPAEIRPSRSVLEQRLGDLATIQGMSATSWLGGKIDVVRKVAEGIHAAEDRCRIFLSGRATDWEPRKGC